MVKEFKTGVKRKAPNPTNWQFANRPEAKELSKFVLPRKINLKSKFPPAYTQTCGSCTANATLACDAYYYHDPKGAWLPSTVFTYYNSRKMDGCKKNDPDDGSTNETALNAIRKYGACNYIFWPNTEPYNKKPSKEAYENGLKGNSLSSTSCRSVSTQSGVGSLTELCKVTNLRQTLGANSSTRTLTVTSSA